MRQVFLYTVRMKTEPTGNKRFGRVLKVLVKRAKLNASLAAAKCGTSRAHWCHFEKGLRRPNPDVLYAMSKLFGRSMEALYEECCPEQAEEAKQRIKA